MKIKIKDPFVFIAIILAVVNIALFVFVLIATNLFTKTDLWFQSACVVIGTILTAVVTLLLLNGQSEKEEQKERNSKVFEEKLKIYKEFLSTLCRIVKDKDVNPEESVELQFQVAQIAMHTSYNRIEKISENVTEIIASIRNTYSDEDKQPSSLVKNLFDIQEQFRQELYDDESNIQQKFYPVDEKIVDKREEDKEEYQKHAQKWNDVVKKFEELSQENKTYANNSETYSLLSEDKLKKFEESIKKKVLEKYKDVNDLKSGFEINLEKEENGKRRNFIRFFHSGMKQRGEVSIQVWLNLKSPNEKREAYKDIIRKYNSSYYAANYCATIYISDEYRYIDSFINEMEKPEIIDLFAKTIIDVIETTEAKIKN